MGDLGTFIPKWDISIRFLPSELGEYRGREGRRCKCQKGWRTRPFESTQSNLTWTRWGRVHRAFEGCTRWNPRAERRRGCMSPSTLQKLSPIDNQHKWKFGFLQDPLEKQTTFKGRPHIQQYLDNRKKNSVASMEFLVSWCLVRAHSFLICISFFILFLYSFSCLFWAYMCFGCVLLL